MAGGRAGRGRFVACLLAGLGLAAGPGACTDKAAPEHVADQFAEAYFRRIDREAARQYTALGATEMLDREIQLIRSVHAGGPAADNAASDVTVRRRGRSLRGDRIRFDYEITARSEAGDLVRSADVELARIQSAWKVVRVDVRSR